MIRLSILNKFKRHNQSGQSDFAFKQHFEQQGKNSLIDFWLFAIGCFKLQTAN